MSHKNDSPNLMKKSSGLLKDCWSICLSHFFSCFNSWKATSGYFPAICRLCFFLMASNLCCNFFIVHKVVGFEFFK